MNLAPAIYIDDFQDIFLVYTIFLHPKQKSSFALEKFSIYLGIFIHFFVRKISNIGEKIPCRTPCRELQAII